MATADYIEDDSEYVALMDGLERVLEDEQLMKDVADLRASIDWSVPFPDEHDARVAWAKKRAFFFRVTGSTLDVRFGEPSLQDVYLSLAKHGMFDSEFVMFGTCQSRLIMLKIARYFKIAIRPDGVYDSLYACCDDAVMLETFIELFAHGHFPSKPEHTALFEQLGARIDVKFAKAAGQGAWMPRPVGQPVLPVVTTGVLCAVPEPA